MGYHVVDPADVDPYEGGGREFRSIGNAIGLEHLGLNHVEAAPGEQVPLRYHYHDTQEEAFYVLEGDLRVETPETEYVVEEGQLFVAEPDSPHRAFNPEDADGPVAVLAIGAPSVDDVHPYEP